MSRASLLAGWVQGAMQGAIFGARSLATGCGPILFAALFSAFSRSEPSALPYFPGERCRAMAALNTFVLACSILRHARSVMLGALLP